MGSITDYLEGELLDHVLNNSAAPQTATVYLALATADPTDAATGASMNEVADSGSYARKAITFGTAGTPTARRIIQSATVTFDQATGSWGTITHWAIVDSATHGAGNVLAHGALASSKSVVSGNTPSVASGEVYVEFSAGEISDYLAEALLDYIFRNQAFTPPATYVALTTATIADTDTGATITEPAGGAYARKLVSPNGGSSPTWDLAASSVVDNTHDIDMTASGASWGTIVAVAIVDNATAGAGNLLLYDNGLTDQAVGDGDTAHFAAGDLDIQMS